MRAFRFDTYMAFLYYYAQADTIEKLNFDFITRVCKATVATETDLTTA